MYRVKLMVKRDGEPGLDYLFLAWSQGVNVGQVIEMPTYVQIKPYLERAILDHQGSPAVKECRMVWW